MDSSTWKRKKKKKEKNHHSIERVIRFFFFCVCCAEQVTETKVTREKERGRRRKGSSAMASKRDTMNIVRAGSCERLAAVVVRRSLHPPCSSAEEHPDHARGWYLFHN